MTINLKNQKLLAIVLAMYTISDFISKVLAMALSDNNDYMDIVPLIPLVVLTVSFFIKNEKVHRYMIAISFFIACIIEVLIIIRLKRSLPLSAFVYLVGYVICGFLVITNNVKKKSLICVFVFALITLSLSLTMNVLYSYLLRFGDYSVLRIVGNYPVFGFIELVCVLLYMLNKANAISAKNHQEITLNTDVISFKDLLSFIENEYQSGKISEDEYNTKRAEILNKL